MLRSKLAPFVALGVLSLAGCGSERSCNEDRCEPPPAPDAGACSDAACSDGLACNGEERCLEGACVAGTPVACAEGTQCHEDAGKGQCVAEQRSPWLVYAGDDLDPSDGLEHLGTYHLLGAPADVAGTMAPRVLSDAAVEPGELGVFEFQWAPDGSSLAFTVAKESPWLAPDTPMRVHWIDFRGGAPSAAQRVTDLPEARNMRLLDFSRDGRSLLSTTRGSLFLSHFEGGASASTVARTLPAATSHDAYFCGDPRYALLEPADGTKLVISLDGAAAQREVGEYVVQSADRAWLAETTPEGVAVSECSPSAAPRLIPRQFPESTFELIGFSADGRYLAYLEDHELDSQLVIASREGEVLSSEPTDSLTTGFWSPREPCLLLSADERVRALHVGDDGKVSEHEIGMQVVAGQYPSPEWAGPHALAIEVPTDETLALHYRNLDFDESPRLLDTAPAYAWHSWLGNAANDGLAWVESREATDQVYWLDAREPAAMSVSRWAPEAAQLTLDALSPQEDYVILHAETVRETVYLELWRVPVAGGEAQRISSGRDFSLAHDHAFQPRP